jgi:hypothetical protein
MCPVHVHMLHVIKANYLEECAYSTEKRRLDHNSGLTHIQWNVIQLLICQNRLYKTNDVTRSTDIAILPWSFHSLKVNSDQ